MNPFCLRACQEFPTEENLLSEQPAIQPSAEKPEAVGRGGSGWPGRVWLGDTASSQLLPACTLARRGQGPFRCRPPVAVFSRGNLKERIRRKD